MYPTGKEWDQVEEASHETGHAGKLQSATGRDRLLRKLKANCSKCCNIH